MKSICEWLCPKRKKTQGPYDVHEETFQMDQHFGQVDFAYKNQSDPTSRTIQQDKGKQQSNESLNFQQPQTDNKLDDMQNDQKKFIEAKNKIQQQAPPPVLVPIAQPQPQPPKQEPPKPKYNILPSKVKKKAFNPQDYYFKQQENQFRVKPIDSIKGQQFNIDGCKNGTYFIFDVTANIYIDDCEDCFIFAAPCESSIFVRSCKNMVIVGIVGQFRTYNCHNCHFSIYCKSQPVIQSSSDIHFSSLKCPEYPELRKQFQQSKLSPWNSNWSQIHNFTKKEGQTHHYLDRQPQYKQQIDWQRAFKEANITQYSPEQNIVPFIQGVLPLQEEQQPTRALIIFNQQLSQNDQKITQWLNQNKIHILRASKSKLNGQKYFTVALLIGNYREDIDFGEVGDPVVVTEEGEIKENQGKYFIAFKDER